MNQHDKHLSAISILAAGMVALDMAKMIQSTKMADRVGKLMAINQCRLKAFGLFEMAGIDVDAILNDAEYHNKI